MPRYQLNVGVLLKSGGMGPNFNLQIDAENFAEALEKAKPAIAQVLAESGLGEQAAAAAAAPEAPPAPPAA